MGSIVSSIFGSSDQTTPAQFFDKSTLSPEQQRVAKLLEQLLTEAVGVTPQPLDAETLSLQALEDLSTRIAGLGAEEGGAIQTGTEALKGVISRGPTDFEDFFQTTIQEPALKSFSRDILPAIGERFAGQFFGGERRESEARATEDLLGSLTRARSSLAFGTQQQDIQNILQASGLLPQFGAAAQQAPLLGLESVVLQQLLGGAQGQRESLFAEQQTPINQLLAFLSGQQKENIVIGPQTVQGQEGIGGDLALMAAKKFLF